MYNGKEGVFNDPIAQKYWLLRTQTSYLNIHCNSTVAGHKWKGVDMLAQILCPFICTQDFESLRNTNDYLFFC